MRFRIPATEFTRRKNRKLLFESLETRYLPTQIIGANGGEGGHGGAGGAPSLAADGNLALASFRGLNHFPDPLEHTRNANRDREPIFST